MRMARRERSLMLVLAAVVLVATAWMGIAERAAEAPLDATRVTHTQPDANGTLSPGDLTDALVAPVLGSARNSEPRLASLWVLPGLVAALAALCLLRRQHLRPTQPARRVLLRGSLSSRAPPLESFA